MDDLWVKLAKGALSLVLFSLAFGALARGSRRSATVAGPGTLMLRYPTSFLVLGIAVFLFHGTFAVMVAFFIAEEIEWWLTAIVAALALVGLWMILVSRLERHYVTLDGMHHHPLFGRDKRLRWDRLDSVEWSDRGKWIGLTARDGTVIQVSAMLTGLAEFAKVLLARAPNARMNDRTRAVLSNATRGQLPSVWH